jgi:hypothetical protein
MIEIDIYNEDGYEAMTDLKAMRDQLVAHIMGWV